MDTVALLVGCHTVHNEVSSLIPSQGICLGCGLDHQWGVCRREMIYVSLSSHLPLSLSLKNTHTIKIYLNKQIQIKTHLLGSTPDIVNQTLWDLLS